MAGEELLSAIGMSGGIQGIGTNLMMYGAMLASLLLLSGLTLTIMWFMFRQLKFNYSVEIHDRVNPHIVQMDKAGIFMNHKTKRLRFFFKKNKSASLDPDKIKYKLIKSFFGTTKKVYLVKKGENNFEVWEPVFTDYKVSQEVTAEDTGWAVNEYDQSIKTYNSDPVWKQLMPYIGMIILMVCVVITVYYLMKGLPDLMQQSIELSKEMTNQMQMWEQARTGSRLIQ